MKYTLHTRCCDMLPTPRNLQDLEDMYAKAKEITWPTFAANVDWKPIAEALGYDTSRHWSKKRGLRLCDDYAVRFTKSTWRGVPCYTMIWSAIDHIFLKE